MSLLWAESLRLDVGPAGLRLSRPDATVLAHREMALDPAGLGAALDALEFAAARRTRLCVRLCNRWARWLVAELPDGLRGCAEREALLRARLQAVYGNQAQGWTLSADDARPGQRTLVCAVERALPDTLSAWARARGLLLQSLVPSWVAGWNAHRMAGALCGGYAHYADGWLCLGLWSRGGWLHVGGEALEAAADFPSVLERRLAAISPALRDGVLHGVGLPSVHLPSGWRAVTQADAP